MSTIIATTLSNGSVSVPTATVVNGSAKAWVNFDGTGTVAIRDSGNVSSVIDSNTGIYIPTFTSSMASVNYVGLTVGGNSSGAKDALIDLPVSASQLEVQYQLAGVSYYDFNYGNMVIHGDLA